MRKFFYLLILFGVLMEISFSKPPSNHQFDLERMQFNAFLPGAYRTVDRYVEPNDTISVLNYFLQMAVWVEVKSENALSVISGNGNPVVKEFPEWQFVTETYVQEVASYENSPVVVHRSVYSDQISMEGNTPIGITVTQTTYE